MSRKVTYEMVENLGKEIKLLAQSVVNLQKQINVLHKMNKLTRKY